MISRITSPSASRVLWRSLVGCLACLLPATALAQGGGLNEPGWNARGGALFLHRSSPGGRLFASSADGDTTFDTTAIDYDWATGWDVGLGCNLNESWGLDARVFRVDGFDSAATIVQPGTGPFPGLGLIYGPDNSGPFGIFSGGTDPTTGTFTFQSELTSCELNARLYPLGENLALLAGFRYVHYQDRVTTTFAKAGGSNSLDFMADNDLFGGQFGAEARLLRWDWFTLDFVGKAGVYGNRTQAALTNRSPTFAFDVSSSAKDGETSFLGELGLLAGVDLTPNISLRCGYQLLWLDAIAVGTSQPVGFEESFPDGPLVVADVHTRGEAFYHGAVVSLELRR